MTNISARLPNDREMDKLLRLARVPTSDSSARSWLRNALGAGRAIAAGHPQPSPAKQNARLNKIVRTAGKLAVALDQLRGHSQAHISFWRFSEFGPVRAGEIEKAAVMSTLKKVRQAAQDVHVHGMGRPSKLGKRHIVRLALAFCARFSTATPSSDEINYFRSFAERFFEHVTGLNAHEKGNGIGRQIAWALQRLPIEKQRAALLNKTHRE